MNSGVLNEGGHAISTYIGSTIIISLPSVHCYISNMLWSRRPTHHTYPATLLSILGLAAVAELIVCVLETNSGELVSFQHRHRNLRSLADFNNQSSVILRDFEGLNGTTVQAPESPSEAEMEARQSKEPVGYKTIKSQPGIVYGPTVGPSERFSTSLVVWLQWHSISEMAIRWFRAHSQRCQQEVLPQWTSRQSVHSFVQFQRISAMGLVYRWLNP